MGGCCGADREQGESKGPELPPASYVETKETVASQPRKSNKKPAGTVNAGAKSRDGKRASVYDSSKQQVVEMKANQAEKPTRRNTLRTSKTISTTNTAVSMVKIRQLKKSIFEDFNPLREMYSDRATTVYLAENRTSHQQQVIKVLRKAVKCGTQKEANTAAEEQFRREIVKVSNFSHLNILKVFNLYEDSSSFYIVAEPVSGGSLIECVTATKSVSEAFAAKVLSQVLQTLRYCHKNKVIHRFLQPSCILHLTVAKGEDPVVKVTGFGSAHLLSDQERLTISVHSAYYIAPEALKRNYSEKSDVWSLGVILYQLLSGSLPFTGQFAYDIVKSIKKEPLAFPESEWSGVSAEVVDLVQGMLSKDPGTRKSAEECLAHPWMLRRKDEPIAEASVIGGSLARLQQFQAKQAVKQGVLTFVSGEIENSEETKEMMKSFSLMDHNRDGVLTREEMIDAYKKTMTRDRACQLVDQMMGFLDIDKSGVIDVSEFALASLSNKSILSHPNLQRIFRTFDEDISGKVSVAEIIKKVHTNDKSASDELWDELVRQVDSNHDGELDFNQFSQLLKLAMS